MRIAVLTSLYPSAVKPREGIFAERRWLRMRDRGHEIVIVQPTPFAPPLPIGPANWINTSRMAHVEERGGLRIHRPRYLHWPGRARSNARAFAKCGLRAIRALGPAPDVIVADYAWPASAIAPLVEPTEISCVVSGRGSDVLQVAGEAGLKNELARYLQSAGRWCGVSQDLVTRMDEIAGRAGHGVLVPNGIDTDLFHPRDRESARSELKIGAKTTVVIAVGSLIPRKDPLLAFAMFEALQQSLQSSSLLVFIGQGPLESKIREETAKRMAGERVRLIGEVNPEELAVWYAAADLLLLCSNREGRPNVVLESLACGLPVLATDAGGTAELLVGLEGMLARTRDPRELAELAVALLSKPRNPEKLFQHVRNLSWDHSCAALESVLLRAIQSKKGIARPD